MTRNEYLQANVTAMGSNPRLSRLVPQSSVEATMGRIQSLKDNRISSTRSLTSEERIALGNQAARFAALLARLPTPHLP